MPTTPTDQDDQLQDTSGNDTIDGQAGDDIITVTGGTDVVEGGSGSDRLVVDWSAFGGFSNFSTSGFSGSLATGYSGTYSFWAESGSGSVTFSGIEHFTIRTPPGTNALTTNPGSAIVVTGDGNDSISTTRGNDAIAPGGGTDSVFAGGFKTNDNPMTGEPAATPGGNRIVYSTGAVPVIVNLSSKSYVVGAGHPLAGTVLPPGSAVDGSGAIDDLDSIQHASGGNAGTLFIDGPDRNIFIGGSGVDTVDYSVEGGPYAVRVNLTDQFRGDGFEGWFAQSARDSWSRRDLPMGIESFKSGPLDDMMWGDQHANRFETGGGNDLAMGGGGDDVLIGGEGDDRLDGESGNDQMFGGSGNDVYTVDSNGDTVSEAPDQGTDAVRTWLASYVLGDNLENLYGLSSDGQRLTGNSAVNVIIASWGNDVLNGAGGADWLTGSKGHDLYYVDDIGDSVNELSDEGVDLVATTVDYSLSDHVENLQANDIYGTAALRLTGNALANNIYGTQGNNVLNGAAGADLMVGYGGHDLYYVDNANDLAHEEANGGTDMVATTVDYTLGANVENLQANDIYGTDPLILTGNSLSNNIYGTQGNNELNGGGGADFMVGYGGHDYYWVDHAGDVAHEEANGGTDTVGTTVSYTLGANVENLQSLESHGTAALTLTGNPLANTIAGSAGDNVLNGAGGADLMIGNGGHDLYFVDDAGDVALEYSTDGGTDLVVTAVSYALGANVENLQANDIGGTAALTLAGNELGNSIWGTNGNNVIAGRGGIDHLFGYGGSDQFLFDTAPSAATNYDFIGDFQGGVDKIALDNSVYTALADGALPASAFVSGTAAADADDRIVYNPANGALFYDADGSGAGAQVLIAFVSSTQPLTAADILVV